MPLPTLPEQAPRFWPRLSTRVRHEAVTARIGRLLGLAFGLCFLTGLFSHYQYHPVSWAPIPSFPKTGYRITQGVHVITGIAAIPLLLAKLWSVYPRLFGWPPVRLSFPPVRTVLQGLERLSIGLLVGSALVELVTGFLNVLQWYAWPWSFIYVHYTLAFVVIGSIVLHIGVKLPVIRRGLATPLDAAEPPTTQLDEPADTPPDTAPDSAPGRPRAGISRRGVLVATAAGVGTVAVTTVGQTATPLRRVALLAPRRTESGAQGVPINMNATDAGVVKAARSPAWRLHVQGPKPFVLDLRALEALDTAERGFPIACVEGWSVMANWRGPSLLDLVRRAGGNSDSHVRVVSLQKGGFSSSTVTPPQLDDALLATHLNGQRLNVDHGYPLRLIAPNRAGVLNTKWLTRLELI